MTKDTMLSRLSFGLAAFAVLAAPWLFGAWEMWWFWGFACLIFLSTALFAVRMLRGGELAPPNQRRKLLLLSFLPFLLYAALRTWQADVLMSAERSFLLFLLPFLLAIQVAYGFSAAQRHRLYAFIMLDLWLLGMYGIINHFVTRNRFVLWVPGYEQYLEGHRATGSYFCPDHFSGIMELAACLGLGILFTRRTSRHLKLATAALVLTGIAGVVFSKSRGGVLTLGAVALAILIWGFSEWRPYKRWCWRISLAAIMASAGILFFSYGGDYAQRLITYVHWQELEGKPVAEKVAVLARQMSERSRGRMISGALRAWREHPVIGIGPGMHQNVWWHVAAAGDGDRESGKWPSHVYKDNYSFEVHSDWVQLLEEYGVIGFILFLIPACLVALALCRGIGPSRESEQQNLPSERRMLTLGALLCVVAMSFHSLGDFNLQMPATGWLLGTVLALALARSTATPIRTRKKRTPDE